MVQHRGVRIQANRLLGMRQGLLGLTQIQQRLPQIGLARGKRCVELHRAAKMFEGLFLAA